MTALNPANDRVDVYSKTLEAHAEVTPYSLVKAALAAGVGIGLSFDGVSGRITISNTLPETGGGGGGGGNFYAKVPYAVAAGTASNITANYTPDVTALGAGDLISVKLLYDIAGPTTLSPDTFGPYPVVDALGAALPVNFAKAGEHLVMEFDGTSLVILNKQASAPAPGLMVPGAIGSLAFAYVDVGGAWPVDRIVSMQPARGYVYGAYVLNIEGAVSGGSQLFGSPYFTGVWRILSVMWVTGDAGERPARCLVQRIS